MPIAKALTCQLLALAAVALALRMGLLGAGSLWPAALSQGLVATGLAWTMRAERWWLPIHLLFLPAVLAASAIGLDPRWYLAAFILSALVFWSTYRTRVPLFLTNRTTVAAISRELERRPSGRLLDLGSGTGSLLRPLARLHPGWRILGVEAAPLPHWLARWMSRGLDNLELRRGDFFDVDWAEFDVVYAFLSPVPMPRVWAKACAEMKPGALLISNSFPAPEARPQRVVTVEDRRGTRLYVYRPGSGKARKGR